MNREIKFRAWNKEKEDYLDEILASLILCVALSDTHGDKGDSIEKKVSLNLEERYELQQFTGLKDKNNKEIYEGDILEDENGFTYKVFWYDVSASFELAEIKEAPDEYPLLKFHARNMSRLAVIGNEYENPELLKG